MKCCKKTALALAVGSLLASLLGGCGLVREYYQRWDGHVDTSLREPTGWYEHAEARNETHDLVVPAGLDEPPVDNSMDVPVPGNASGPVGESMDVRPPIVPLRSDLGLRGQWGAGEAIVWFERGGSHGIFDEESAWALLDSLLKQMRVGVGKVTDGAYELTTMSADYNEYGAPYNAADLSSNALRYHQIYKIRVGRNDYGEVGIATQLIGSMTMLSSGYMLENLLSDIELQRFSTGFANNVIRMLDKRAHEGDQSVDYVDVTLGRDNNNQDCLVVTAPYKVVWDSVKSMLPKYSFKVKEYSLSSGTITVEAEEEEAEFFRQRGVQPFSLEDGTYKLRVGELQGKATITFYNGDDKPLSPSEVGRIYSGFSQALAREIESYRSQALQPGGQ
ncbi:MAG: outer membrane protein assembly factor BamC [Succinivibrionaceae bacterium]|nr:outer membrane protein assembly factor BamC [Succinivibrionaceae bacterium]